MAIVTIDPLAGHGLGELKIAVQIGDRGVTGETDFARGFTYFKMGLQEGRLKDGVFDGLGVKAMFPPRIDVFMAFAALHAGGYAHGIQFDMGYIFVGFTKRRVGNQQNDPYKKNRAHQERKGFSQKVHIQNGQRLKFGFPSFSK